MIETLLKWSVFRVIIGLLPIGLNALRVATVGGLKAISLVALFSRGELLLISCAIAAGGLGELVSSHKRHGWARILSGGGCAISLAGGAYWFAFISGQVDRGDYDREFVATYSLYLYLFNLAAALGCIILAELGKRPMFPTLR